VRQSLIGVRLPLLLPTTTSFFRSLPMSRYSDYSYTGSSSPSGMSLDLVESEEKFSNSPPNETRNLATGSFNDTLMTPSRPIANQSSMHGNYRPPIWPLHNRVRYYIPFIFYPANRHRHFLSQFPSTDLKNARQTYQQGISFTSCLFERNH
jgi:hypothetical protein